MCISACALAHTCARVCECVWGCVFLCACVYVCVHGRYLEGLTVDGERESQVCVYSPVARYKVVASSRSVLVNEETIISSMC